MERRMRRSRVLAQLRAGKVVSCFKLNLADARAVEIAAMSGFDCIWLDMEHVPNDLAVVERGIWAAKSQDVDVMARVARTGPGELCGDRADSERVKERSASGAEGCSGDRCSVGDRCRSDGVRGGGGGS